MVSVIFSFAFGLHSAAKEQSKFRDPREEAMSVTDKITLGWNSR